MSHEVQKSFRSRSGKTLALLVSVVLILTAAIGGTVAYIYMATDPVENKFTPSEVTTEVDEDFDGTVKDDVKIKNTGDTEAYIRAAVAVVWKDADGNVAPVVPEEDTDYIIDYCGVDDGDWLYNQHADGFYYCTTPIAPGESTPVLFTGCQVKEGVTPPEGYYLAVDIIASGVQSTPTTAVIESWGVDPTKW